MHLRYSPDRGRWFHLPCPRQPGNDVQVGPLTHDVVKTPDLILILALTMTLSVTSDSTRASPSYNL